MAHIPWGFYGHKKINRMAVFTLPSEMFEFYKKNIEYITEHAVDPDKRRYATKLEAIRHYIDIDHWGVMPFDNVPRTLSDAIATHAKIFVLSPAGDSTLLVNLMDHSSTDSLLSTNDCTIDLHGLRAWLKFKLFAGQLIETDVIVEDEKEIPWLQLKTDLPENNIILFQDQFSSYGIAPYFSLHMLRSLTRAFKNKDGKRILRMSAEIGHYIGDIHVPLHTTENYNGELTDQVGIHAFWETRLPELFADESYDFMVGRASYIFDQENYFWDVVFDSHELLDEVLDFEKSLSESYPADQQYCYEERNQRTIRTECEAYAKAYHESMEGMVEQRMQDAILSIGSVWFSAWVDAGQPDLSELVEDVNWVKDEEVSQAELDKKFQEGSIKGRTHN